MKKLKIIQLNIERDKHYEKIRLLVERENPDILCFQEVFEDDVLELEKVTGCNFSYFAKTNESSRYRSAEGNAIFAKQDFFRTKQEFIVEMPKDAPPRFYDFDFQFKAVIATFQFDDFLLNVCSTHLPVSDEGEVIEIQKNAVDVLLSKLEKYDNFVLCGDMNTPRGAGLFDKMSEKYQDNIPKDVDTTIDPKLHRVKGLKFVIDGFFTSKNLTVKSIKLVDGVSDHLAVVGIIDLDLQ